MKLRTKSWLAVTATAGLVLGGVSPALAAGTAGPTEHTDMGVNGDAVMEHLQKISDISTKHADEGFRCAGQRPATKKPWNTSNPPSRRPEPST
jgi:hypothetical protein